MIPEIEKLIRELEAKSEVELSKGEIEEWKHHPFTVKFMSYLKLILVESYARDDVVPVNAEAIALMQKIAAEKGLIDQIINWTERQSEVE